VRWLYAGGKGYSLPELDHYTFISVVWNMFVNNFADGIVSS
jgi:hypothetical protein